MWHWNWSFVLGVCTQNDDKWFVNLRMIVWSRLSVCLQQVFVTTFKTIISAFKVEVNVLIWTAQVCRWCPSFSRWFEEEAYRLSGRFYNKYTKRPKNLRREIWANPAVPVCFLSLSSQNPNVADTFYTPLYKDIDMYNQKQNPKIHFRPSAPLLFALQCQLKANLTYKMQKFIGHQKWDLFFSPTRCTPLYRNWTTMLDGLRFPSYNRRDDKAFFLLQKGGRDKQWGRE